MMSMPAVLFTTSVARAADDGDDALIASEPVPAFCALPAAALFHFDTGLLRYTRVFVGICADEIGHLP
jgi:hypothetical protein